MLDEIDFSEVRETKKKGGALACLIRVCGVVWDGVRRAYPLVSVDGRTDGWMDGRMDGSMDGWMDGWTDGWMDGWMDRLMDGWMNGQID